jgi:hypothetical protein
MDLILLQSLINGHKERKWYSRFIAPKVVNPPAARFTIVSFFSPNKSDSSGSSRLPKGNAENQSQAKAQKESTRNSMHSAREENCSGGSHQKYELRYQDQVQLPYTYVFQYLLT